MEIQDALGKATGALSALRGIEVWILSILVAGSSGFGVVQAGPLWNEPSPGCKGPEAHVTFQFGL